MQTVGAVWVMLELKGSPTFVALVATASSLPTVFLGVAGGALADLLDRRRLLLVTQILMLAAAAALAALDASGGLTPSSLLALTFALGVGAALNGPAWQAIQPELVPRDEFPQAVTLGGANINLGRALGPALGGFILAVAEPWLVFALNARPSAPWWSCSGAGGASPTRPRGPRSDSPGRCAPGSATPCSRTR